MATHLKSRSTILLYKDLLRITKKIQPSPEGRKNVSSVIRSQFEANRNETDFNKIETFREDAIRGIGNFMEMEAAQAAGKH